MKPDWKDAPEWATWVARDQDGEWYWYEFEPIARFETFAPRTGRCESAKLRTGWHEMKEARP